MSEPPIVTAEAVGISIGGRAVLEAVDLRLAPATIVALLGENCAGKTTLMRTLCGRIKPSRGQVRIRGRDPRLVSAARREIGYVPQSIALYPELTVRENLSTFRAYGRTGRPRSRSEHDIIEALDIHAVADRRVGQLSGGYQRRVNLGAALLSSPAFLVLDEPTVGLDAAAKAILLDVVRSEAERGAAILMTTHDLDAASAVADHIAVLARGRIVSKGRPRELIDRTFGDRMSVTFRFALPLDPGLAERLSGHGLVASQIEREWRSSPRGVSPDAVAFLTGLVESDRRSLERLAISRPGLRDLYEAVITNSANP